MWSEMPATCCCGVESYFFALGHDTCLYILGSSQSTSSQWYLMSNGVVISCSNKTSQWCILLPTILLYYFSKHLAPQLYMPQLHYLQTLCFSACVCSSQQQRSAIWPVPHTAVQ